MQPASLLGRITNVKNPVVRGSVGGSLGGQCRQPARTFVANRDHLAPDFCDPLHVSLVFLEKHDHAIDLLQLGEELLDFPVHRLVFGRVSETIIKLSDRRVFERIQIIQLQSHAAKLPAANLQVNAAQEPTNENH